MKNKPCQNPRDMEAWKALAQCTKDEPTHDSTKHEDSCKIPLLDPPLQVLPVPAEVSRLFWRPRWPSSCYATAYQSAATAWHRDTFVGFAN